MSKPALLADHIDEQTEAILAHWRATVEQDGDVPEAARLPRGEFLDHIPALLDRLAERLRGRGGDASREGQEHGRHRWRQGYDIAALVNEFSHLRAALNRATAEFARAHGWDVERFESALAAVHDVIDEATAESVRQFQEDSRRETREALAEVKARQRATEEAWVAAKLERSKLRAVLRSLPVAVWVVDGDGAIVGANPEAERMQGFALGAGDRPNVYRLGPEFRLVRPDGIACPGDEFPVVRALRRGEVVTQEEYVWGQRHITVNAAPLTDPDGRMVGAVVVAVDVTERNRFESALAAQKAVAEEASRHKTRLLAALSHDARTPLNAVVLAAELLEIHFKGEPDAEVQECLRTIRHSVRNVLDLLNDLLNLSKIDAGAVPAEVTRFPVGPMLAECLASVETQARMKGLEVRNEPGPLDGLSLETDRAKLKQILCNFLTNALRYTDAGHVRLYGERTDGQVRVSVEDTGVGIAPADQARIFDEFAVLDHPQRKPGEGTGLGLAICRRLAHLLGGGIELRSEPGSGSTFTLVLPIAALTPNAPPGAAPGPDASGPGAGAILIVEDHPESRQTLARVLRRIGYRVLEAADGRDALAVARGEPDLRAVLMDVNMPVMDGVEATRALRADPDLKDVPIFALTGDVTVVNQHRIAEAGVNGFLEKPVTWEALREALATAGERTPAVDRPSGG